MTEYSKNGITLMQFILIIHQVQLGNAILQLPSNVAESAGTDGWISVILGGLFTTGASLIMIQLMKKFPNGTILELVAHYFGKWAGKLITILFALYFGIIGFLSVIRSLLFMNVLVFPEFQVSIVFLLVAIPIYLIAKNNVRVLGRYCELVFFLISGMFLLMLVPLKDAHWLHLLPILKEGWQPVLKGVEPTILAFSGIIVVLFIYPFLQKKESATKGVIIANGITLFIQLMVVLFVFAVYSPDEVSRFNTPLIDYLKIIEFEFIERIEIIVLSFYFFIMSTTWVVFISFSVFCSSRLFGKKDHSKHLLWFLILLSLFVIWVPPSFPRNDKNFLQIKNVILAMEFGMPLLFLIMLRVQALFQRRSLK